jgi:predicted ATPase/DNA-binding winged helix-turn-helix (wHTH) protein
MISIGGLQVDFTRREIRHNKKLLRVSSRAFDILELLANANGALVSKNEIMRVVWPTTVVEGNNLQVHISALRKTFGVDSELIRTVAGRGYRLVKIPNPVNETSVKVAPSYVEQDSDAPPISSLNAKIQSRVTSHTAELVGRDRPLKELLVALKQHSVVTLVGTGGIGKTRLALEAARHASPDFANGVAIVPLASVTDEHFALEALATALGLKITGCLLTMDAITKALRGKKLLIVLDNCEHVIDAAANIALELSNASHVVLATSRELLRIPAEMVFPVPSLEVTVEKSRTNDVQTAAAVRLFLARVRAAEPGFQADEKCMDLIGALCRSLDGIPLAIELAAARAATLGVEALTCLLGDNLRILTGGYRTAMPRHQTMRATLDWSYRLLTDLERAIFRRLGTFVGGFTLDALRFLAKREGWSDGDMSEAFSGLIFKSMVFAPSQGPERRYRLLETTRQYALQRLDDNGERSSAATVHADYLMTLINSAHTHWTEQSDDSWIAVFSSELDNVRAALEWSLSPNGDASIGVALASAAVPLFFELSLVSECGSRAGQALEVFKNAAICKVSPCAVLRLQSAMAAALVLTSGPVDEARRAWSKIYSDAVVAGDVEHEARALWGLWNAHQYGGEPRDALIMAQRFRGLAGRTGKSTLCLLGMRIEGAALHYLGKQAEARENLEAMLRTYDQSIHQWKTIGHRIEHGIVARATLARVLWVQGDELKAMEMAQDAFQAAIAYDNEIVTCHVLVESVIPIALMRDDLKSARLGIAALSAYAVRVSFHTWIACCECYEMCAAMMSNPAAENVSALESKISQLRITGYLAPLTFLLWKECEALLKRNELDAALAAVDQALNHCDATGERWLHAELCRIKGSILMALGNGLRAGEWLALALTIAQRQGSKTFEDRAKSCFSYWLESNHHSHYTHRSAAADKSTLSLPTLSIPFQQKH